MEVASRNGKEDKKMRTTSHFGPKNKKDNVMANHIDAIIDSHIRLRGWSRLVSLGDLIAILQTEYEAVSKAVNKPD